MGVKSFEFAAAKQHAPRVNREIFEWLLKSHVGMVDITASIPGLRARSDSKDGSCFTGVFGAFCCFHGTHVAVPPARARVLDRIRTQFGDRKPAPHKLDGTILALSIGQRGIRLS